MQKEEELPCEALWGRPDDRLLRRVEKVFNDLAVPVDEQAEFALKNIVEGGEADFGEAQRFWEEASEAFKDHRMGVIRGESSQVLDPKRQRCMDAAQAMLAIGDVASFKGKPFTELFAFEVDEAHAK